MKRVVFYADIIGKNGRYDRLRLITRGERIAQKNATVFTEPAIPCIVMFPSTATPRFAEKYVKVTRISYSTLAPAMVARGIEEAKDLVAYCALFSNPANQANTKTAHDLLRYLIHNSNWSPLERVSTCIKIETTRDIARQILRHRFFTFQEFFQRYAVPTKELNFVAREARLQNAKKRAELHSAGRNACICHASGRLARPSADSNSRGEGSLYVGRRKWHSQEAGTRRASSRPDRFAQVHERYITIMDSLLRIAGGQRHAKGTC